jgi:hypothetical protein
MGNEIVPSLNADTAHAVEEVAKATGKTVDLAGKAGGYVTSILGTIPHNLLGIVDDRLAFERFRLFEQLQIKKQRILSERGVAAPYEKISPSIEIPLLEAAVDESREELAELWAKLLAAASDPKRKNSVRLSFIATIKQMDPLDAKVLETLYGRYQSGFTAGTNGRDVLSTILASPQDEVLVSFSRLEQLECVGFAIGHSPKISPIITPYGRLLMHALN